MAKINPSYLNLSKNYLFSEITARVKVHLSKNPSKRLIRLGIGDVTKPFIPAIITALQKAVAEQGTKEGFRGYGPELGYDFLREAIAKTEYDGMGIQADEIFVSDGAKCDIGNLQEIFSLDTKMCISEPSYPVYIDSNVMSYRGGPANTKGCHPELIYLPSLPENNFLPVLPSVVPDVIYLCYPNNPTGTVMTKDQLAVWVNYAKANDCVIIFDAAYESFIREPGIPHSIYEVPGAIDVAIECRSYSKTAGFTGLRCGSTVVPRSVMGTAPNGERVPFRDLWARRQTTKYNGCPYIVQRGAEAVHTPEGKAQTRVVIDEYMANANKLRQAFEDLGLFVVGGKNAPYVWVKLPDGTRSWDFFDRLLAEACIVGTPGVGFGPTGEGCFRFTGFGTVEDTEEAIERLKSFKF